MIDVKQLERFPIVKTWWDRGYVNFLFQPDDIPVRIISTHACEHQMGFLDYMDRFLEAHNKQIEGHLKLFIKEEQEAGFEVDPEIIKKYL